VGVPVANSPLVSVSPCAQAPNPVLKPEPLDLVAELEAAQRSGDDDALRAVMAKLNAQVASTLTT
jgi:hypothetical protein